MQTVIAWFNAWWWLVLLIDVIVMKILNATTRHFSEHKGLVKVLLYIVDILDILKTTPAPGRPPRTPGATVMRCLTFIMVVCFALSALDGCGTTDTGKKKFDPCSALMIANGTHQAAGGISTIVCAAITDPTKRAECFKKKMVYESLGETILQLGAAAIKACTAGGGG